MSTNVSNSIDVSLDTTDVTLETTKDIVVPAAHEITIDEASSTVEGYKKEYSIVGDGLYASVNTAEAPEWLTTIIDSVIANGLSTSLSDLIEARNSIQTALEQLDVAENNYTQAINIIANIDQVIATEVQTLNATVAGNKAEVIDLIATKATPTEATAIAVQQIEASITDPDGAIKTSVIDHFDTAIANVESTFSQSIDSIESTFETQQGDLEASANAISGLQTYIGVTDQNVPDGTGILESIEILQKQTDGLVETFVDTHELLNYVNDDDVTPESLRFDQYPYVLWTPMEGTSNPTATTRIAYHDSTPQSYPIPEHTVYKNTSANTYWEYHPTTAGGWEEITEDEYNTRLITVRQAHVGDSYIRYEYVLGVKQYVEAYKFIKTAPDTTPPYLTDSEGYGWIVVNDSAAESAYIAALNAYDLADGKRRVFTETPFIPYDRGDLWVDSSVSPQIVKVATVDNTLGYNSNDWVQADQQAEDFITNTYEPDSAQIHRQLDGKIEYTFYDSYTDIPGAINESAALWIMSLSWNTQELKDNANGNVVYFKDTQNAYWYSASTNTWLSISDTSVFSALQAAEGKVSQFYAWGGSNAPADYTFTNNAGAEETVLADNFKYWLKPSDNKLYYKPATTWILVPTDINNSGTWLASGDIATVYDPTLRDTTSYNYNGTSWQQIGPTGLVSKSKFFVDLENEVIGDNGHVATSISNLESSSIAYTNEVGAGVENKFAYDSIIKLNGNYYEAGFGLDSSAVSGGTGTEADPYNSEFWINAEKFRFTNTNQTGSVSPFTIDASGTTPQITFNGVVSFTNVNGTPTHTTGTSAPSGTAVAGSSYIQTSTTPATVWVYNNGWKITGDPVSVANAAQAASDAQDTADSRPATFRQDTAPTFDQCKVNDIWINTSEDDSVYVLKQPTSFSLNGFNIFIQRYQTGLTNEADAAFLLSVVDGYTRGDYNHDGYTATISDTISILRTITGLETEPSWFDSTVRQPVLNLDPICSNGVVVFSTDGGWERVAAPNTIMSTTDTTKINGGTIETGSVYADAIYGGVFQTTQLTSTTLPSNYTGTVMDSTGIRVYENGVLRVKLGNLA